MQRGVRRIGCDGVEVLGNGAHVFIDGPLVVIQHHDQPLRVRGGIVQSFKGGAASEGGIACHHHDVIVSPFQVPPCGHAQAGREGRACVTGSVAVVLTFRAETKAVESFVLADRVDLVPAARQHLVNVGLMGHIEDELVLRSVKHPMHGDGELHDAKIWP